MSDMKTIERQIALPLHQPKRETFNLNNEVEKRTLPLGNNEETKIKSLKNKVFSLRGTTPASEEQINKKSEEFEAVFISQMLGHMFAGQKTDEMFGGGESEKVYKDMLTNEYGKMIARSGGIGVSDHVKREMIRMQGIE